MLVVDADQEAPPVSHQNDENESNDTRRCRVKRFHKKYVAFVMALIAIVSIYAWLFYINWPTDIQDLKDFDNPSKNVHPYANTDFFFMH